MKISIFYRYIPYVKIVIVGALMVWMAYVTAMSIVTGANFSIIVIVIIFLGLFVTTSIALKGESLFSVIAVSNYCALLLFYIPSIPKISPIPLAPKYLFFLLTFALFFANAKIMRSFKINKEALAILFCFLFMGLILVVSGMYMKLLVFIEPAVIFLATWLAVGGRERNALFVVKFVGAFLLLSAIWLTASIFFVEPFLSVREYLYASKVVSGSEVDLISMSKPTGFTFHHHIMGYQISIGAVLAAFFFLYENRLGRKIFNGVAFSAMLLGMLLAGQRSAMVAVVVAFFTYVVIKKQYKALALIFVVGAIAVLLSNKMQGDPFGRVLPWGTTHSKVIMATDSSARLGWQMVALKSIAGCPLGYVLQGKSWDAEAIEGGADFSGFDYETKAVHNSYLGVALNYGWIGALLMIGALFLLVKKILKSVSENFIHNLSDTYFIATGMALAAALVQALFHNSSIFTNEPSSCVILCLFLVWSDLLQRTKVSGRSCCLKVEGRGPSQPNGERAQ